MKVSPQKTTVAKLRCAAGLSQKQAAAIIGISTSYMQKIELGIIPASSRVSKTVKSFLKSK